MSQTTQPKPIMTDEPDKDPTISDVIKAISKMSTGIDERFESIDKRFDKLEATMATKSELAAAVVHIDKIEDKIDHITTKMVTKDELDNKLATIETRLVTKPYLDEKLYDLKGDLIVIARKEDRKVDSVISLLRQKNIFSAQETAEVLSTAVFSKTI